MKFYSDLILKDRKILQYSVMIFVPTALCALVSFLWFDHSLSLYFNAENLMPFRKAARFLTDIGLSENFFVLSSLLFLILHWFDRVSKDHPTRKLKPEMKWVKRWSANFFLALVFSGLTVLFFKFAIGRQRPHVSDSFEPYVFASFNLNSYFQSMPSGHSQVVFCVATMAALLWPRASWSFYLVAFVLAFTRVVVHAHFLSDVLFGAMVGHLGTLWYLWLMETRFPKHLSLRR